MKPCQHCGTLLPENAHFCGTCGQTPFPASPVQVAERPVDPVMIPPQPVAAPLQSPPVASSSPPFKAKPSGFTFGSYALPAQIVGIPTAWILSAIMLLLLVVIFVASLSLTLRGSVSPTGTNATTTPAPATSTGSFTFSGSLTGPMTITSFPTCGSVKNGAYLLTVNGKIKGTAYQLSITIKPYNGARTYTSHASISLAHNAGTKSTALANDGHLSEKIAITHNGKAGTITTDLVGVSQQGPARVHVVGNWTCA
ncbi:MAG TPA: zinc ribbon domain-containing protein [Ktedonobacteraceae bacterium]|nr:zinc ribbon domain-containing protein [Ktedonobacteraceae bacterium]